MMSRANTACLLPALSLRSLASALVGAVVSLPRSHNRPQSYIALSKAVGIPNNGDMRIAERIRLAAPDTLVVELTITAPRVLTEPWTTTRLWVRRRGELYDIVEGQCVQGELVEALDDHGNAIFEHAPPADDGRVPLGR